LELLLEELGYGDKTVATAVNQSFVRNKDRGAIRLAEGDAVEIVTPRQGG
jgi:sulfur carrier protein